MLAMALCLALAGTAVLMLDRKPSAGPETDELFPNATPEKIENLTLTVEGKSLALERATPLGTPESKIWVARKPSGARIDQKAADRFTGLLLSLKRNNPIAPDEQADDLSVYGLVPPQIFLSMSGPFGRYIASIGKEHPLTKRRYGQIEGASNLFLLDGSTVEGVLDTADAIRSKRPFEFTSATIESFSVLNTGRGMFVFQRSADKSAWSMIWEEQTYSVDSAVVDQKLDELLSIKVRTLYDPDGSDLAIYGLATPTLNIGLKLSSPDLYGKTDYAVDIGRGVSVGEKQVKGQGEVSAGVGYFLKVADEPTVYELVGRTFSFWMQHPDGFRKRRPFAELDVGKIVSVTIKRAGQPDIVWKRADGNGWTPAQKNWLELARQMELINYIDPKVAENQHDGFAASPLLISYSVEGVPKEMHIMIGGALPFAGAPAKRESAASNSSSGSKSEESEAPRYAEVVAEDGYAAFGIIAMRTVQAAIEGIPKKGE